MIQCVGLTPMIILIIDYSANYSVTNWLLNLFFKNIL